MKRVAALIFILFASPALGQTVVPVIPKTSAAQANVLQDETGTGLAVFNANPTLNGATVTNEVTVDDDVDIVFTGPGGGITGGILNGVGVSGVTSSVLKTDSSGVIAAATSGSDFALPAPCIRTKTDGTQVYYGTTATTDAERGAALRSACNAAITGDRITLGPGTFDIGANAIRGSQFPARVRVEGCGVGVTKITTTGTSALGVLWEPGDDNVVSGLSYLGTLTNGSAQLLFGNDADTVDAATGVILSEVYLSADSDCFYVLHATNAMQAKAYDSVFESKYDTVYTSGASHQLEFFNCNIVSNNSGSGANTGGLVRAVRGASGSIWLTGCKLDVTLGAPGDFLSEVYAVNWIGSGTLYATSTRINITSTLADGSASGVRATAGTVNLDNVSVTTAITSGATAAGVEAAGGTINFHAGRVTTTSGIGNHLSRSSGTLNIGPAVTWSTSGGTITRLPAFGVTLATGVPEYLGTPSAANFAAMQTGETGTGAPVLATSPTLVTPVLGTATATTITAGTSLLAPMFGDANGSAFSSSFGAMRIQLGYIWLGNSDDTRLNKTAAGVFGFESSSTPTGGTVNFVGRTPAQITAAQNDYNPGGVSYFQRWSSDAARNVTGLTFTPAKQNGQCHLIVNVGAQNIVLVNESASSTAANRFTNSTGADITLSGKQAADVIYDTTTSRWLVFKRN